MSDNNNNNQTEQELWDVLTEPVTADTTPEPKAKPKPKTGPRFASSAPVKDVQPARRKLDGFFFACMAGVAAVSVAATLVISGMIGGNGTGTAKLPDSTQTNPPAVSTTGPGSMDNGTNAALEQENAQLREQLQLQKQQIKDLQAQILDLTGSTAALPSSPADPQQSAQVEAYELFNQIKEAYADFDRETLERLIPEMDKRIGELSQDALNEYYQILEYMEMPSNG